MFKKRKLQYDKWKWWKCDNNACLDNDNCGQIGTGACIYKYSNALKKLDLSKDNLTLIPPEIGIFTALKELDLRENKLTSLPVEIGDLINLECLYLSYNLLKSIPAGISRLVTLKELYLNNNRIRSISAEIGELRLLEKLHLDHNEFTSIPLEFAQLSALKEIYLGNNEYESALIYAVKDYVLEILRLEKLPWSEQNHRFHPLRTRKSIFTILMIASVKNRIPLHPETSFYKLPREILYTIFRFICCTLFTEFGKIFEIVSGLNKGA